jgi:hypothetical protein
MNFEEAVASLRAEHDIKTPVVLEPEDHCTDLDALFEWRLHLAKERNPGALIVVCAPNNPLRVELPRAGVNVVFVDSRGSM